MADRLKSILLLISLHFGLILGSNHIPVLLWSNQNHLEETPQALAGHGVATNTFLAKYLQPLIAENKQTLVAFIQDKLSTEDFTTFGDVYNEQSDGATFHNVKNSMDKYSSKHISMVENPGAAISSLSKQFPGEVHEVRNGKPTIKPGHMYIIHLPDTRTPDKTARDSLKNNDGIIGEVMNQLSSQPFTALFTAKEPARRYERSEAVSGRHLLQTPGANSFWFYNITDDAKRSCLLFYANKMNITIQGSSVNRLLLNPSEATQKSLCGKDTASLKLTFTNPSFTKLEMAFTFMLTSKYYWGTNMTIEYSGSGFSSDGPKMTNANKVISAATPMSYHCFNSSLMQNTDVLTTYTGVVVIDGLQVQAFGITKNKFSAADDCVGFFTLPIWMGLFTAVILIGILTFGLFMIMQVETMDRFDDPKGKTITVNVATD